MKQKLFAICNIFLCSVTFSQPTILRGTVQDAENREPLRYTNIKIANTRSGTVSNSNGEFVLSILELPITIVVSYVGYTSDSLLLENRTSNPITILLKKQPIILPEVVVLDQDPTVMELVQKVYRKMRDEEDDKYTGKAFYRQYGQGDTTYTEVQEIFFRALLNNNRVLDKSIEQGRYAMARRAIGDTTPLFSVKNLSELSTEYFAISQRKESFFSFLPFVQKTATYRPLREDASDFYIFQDGGSYADKGRKIAVVRFTPKSNLDKPAFEGSLKIDVEDSRILSIEESLNDSRIDLFPYEFRGYYQKDYVLSYKAECTRIQSRYYLKNLETQLSFKEKHRQNLNYEKKWYFRSFLIFYDYLDSVNFGPKRQPKENSDIANIKNVQFDPNFWNEHQQLLDEIPLEENIKQSFLLRGFYGNLIPGGIKVPSQ